MGVQRPQRSTDFSLCNCPHFSKLESKTRTSQSKVCPKSRNPTLVRPLVFRHRKHPGLLTRFHVPKLDRGIDAPGHEKAIVAGEDQTVDVEFVPFDREKLLTSLNVPHQDLDIHIISPLLI